MAIGEATRKLFDLGGRVAVVTGGNRGIGRAIAFALADAGATVAIMGRDEEKNRETVEELKKLGVPALALRVDLMKRADLKPAMDEVERVLGPIDILVNNAAFAILKGVLDQTAEEWDQVIATNLNACFLLAQIAARSMVARKRGGKIINVSSIAGNFGSPVFPSYAVAKGGLQFAAPRMVFDRHDRLDSQLAGMGRGAEGDDSAHAARTFRRAR